MSEVNLYKGKLKSKDRDVHKTESSSEPISEPSIDIVGDDKSDKTPELKLEKDSEQGFEQSSEQNSKQSSEKHIEEKHMEENSSKNIAESIEESIEENPYLHNPLHGVGLKTVLYELVTHYGFDILHAYLNINCFRSNPSLSASEKFLKKTDWAREKVEVFYLYQYKNLPKVSSEQFKLPPRERIVPEQKTQRDPAVLSIEDGERLQDKRSKNAASRNSHTGERKGSSREYNEQRNAGHYKSQNKYQDKSRNESSGDSPYKKPRDDNQGSKSSFYKSDNDFDSGNNDSTPTPPKDPWGNFKGGK